MENQRQLFQILLIREKGENVPLSQRVGELVVHLEQREPFSSGAAFRITY